MISPVRSGILESCLKIVPDYFELIVLAAYRAQEIAASASPALAANRDRGPTLALKEIASGAVNPNDLRERLVSGFQECSFLVEDDPEFF